MQFGYPGADPSNRKKGKKDTRFLPTLSRRTGRLFSSMGRAMGVVTPTEDNGGADMSLQTLNATYEDPDDLSTDAGMGVYKDRQYSDYSPSDLDGKSIMSNHSEDMRAGRSHSGVGTWRDSEDHTNTITSPDHHDIKISMSEMTNAENEAALKFSDPESLIGYKIGIRHLGNAVVLATKKDWMRTSYFTVLMDDDNHNNNIAGNYDNDTSNTSNISNSNNTSNTSKASNDVNEDVLVDIYLRRKKKLAKGYPFKEIAYIGLDGNERTALALHRLLTSEVKDATGNGDKGKNGVQLCSPEQVMKMRQLDDKRQTDVSITSGNTTDNDDEHSDGKIENKKVSF